MGGGLKILFVGGAGRNQILRKSWDVFCNLDLNCFVDFIDDVWVIGEFELGFPLDSFIVLVQDIALEKFFPSCVIEVGGAEALLPNFVGD